MAAPLVLFKNNASSLLYGDIDAVTTSIRVLDTEGVKFPQPTGGQFFFVTLEDRRSKQIEICKATGRTNDIINVVRAQEGTTAQAFLMGATVSNRFTAGTMDTYFDYAWSQSEADARFLNVAGDTAMGPLYAPAADPVANTELAHKAYVDKRVLNISQITVSPAVSLVYQATASQTTFNLITPDIYGHTYVLSTASVDVEPIDVHVAGLKKIENTVGGLGEYTVNRAANTIVLDVGASVGNFVAIDVYTPRNVSPVVSVWLLKQIVPDGNTTHFEMRRARDNVLVDAASNEEVAIYVNNVPQKPGEDYTALNEWLDFMEAPEADADIWGLWTKTGGEPQIPTG